MYLGDQPYSSLHLAKAFLIFHLEANRALPSPLSVDVAEHSTGQGGRRLGFLHRDHLLHLSLRVGSRS